MFTCKSLKTLFFYGFYAQSKMQILSISFHRSNVWLFSYLPVCTQPQEKTYHPTKSFSLRRRKTYRGAYTRGERSFSVEIASHLLLFSFFFLLIFLSQKQNVHFLEGTRIGLDILLNGLLWWHRGKESTCPCWWHRFDAWVRKIPWRRKW